MSTKVFNAGTEPNERVAPAELLLDIASKVSSDRDVAIFSRIDHTGVFVAVYLPKGKVTQEYLKKSMDEIGKLCPTCDVEVAKPDSKAITVADEQRLELEATHNSPQMEAGAQVDATENPA